MNNVWITFTAAMAAEVLAGRKDQTRRLAVRWKVGDMLRVKEPIRRGLHDLAFYSADGTPTGITWRWKPSGLPGRFMPGDLCRIEREVVEVRREPLQNITDEDIAREGVSRTSLAALLGREPKGTLTPRQMWALGWNAINGKTFGASWAENPSVFVTTFRRVEVAGA